MKTLNTIIKSLLLFILTQTILFAGYTTDKSYTTYGKSSYTGGKYSDILKLEAFISGTNLTLKVRKTDGSSFSTSGYIHFKVGSPETYGVDRTKVRINRGNYSKSYTHNLASYSSSGYPKKFYVRYEADNGGWAWVGAITVSHFADKPSTPSRPNATAQGANKVYISWSKVSGATNYKLYRATSPNGTYKQIYYANRTYYTDSGTHLSANTTYYYKLRAGNSSGWSNYSSYRSIKTLVAVPTITSVSPSSLNEGDKNKYIYINGNNLDSVTKVFIAGVINTTSFISKTATQIKVKSTYVNGSGNKGVPKGDRPIEVLYGGGKKVTKSGLLFVTDKVPNPYKNLSDWAVESADKLIEKNIIDLPTDKDLRGRDNANRVELLTMIYRVLGRGKSNADSYFKNIISVDALEGYYDINDKSIWYYNPVMYISNLSYRDNITVFDHKIDENKHIIFNPAEEISRAWALKAILESLNIKPLSNFSKVKKYDDVEFTHPASGYIYQAQKLGLISANKSSFRPNYAIQREELFVVIFNIYKQNLTIPNISENDFNLKQSDFSGAIGIRYEQPICYNTTAPKVSITKLSQKTMEYNGVKVYALDLKANINGGSSSCIDANGDTHIQSLFTAWRTERGKFIDLTPTDSEIKYKKVRLILPNEYNDNYKVSLYVGDNLGNEILKELEIKLDKKPTSNIKPTITMNNLNNTIKSSSELKLSGTAMDNSNSINSGIAEVILEYSFDNSNWKLVGRNIGVDANNQWSFKWQIPFVEQQKILYIRAKSKNNIGNFSSNFAKQNINILPILNLSAFVVDEKGKSIVNARVTLIDANGKEEIVLSDNNGFVNFNNLKSGSYALKANLKGDESDTINITLNYQNPSKDIRVVLKKTETPIAPVLKEVASISLKVGDNYSIQLELERGTEPITFNISSNPNSTISVNSSGFVEWSSVTEGNYTIIATAINSIGSSEKSWKIIVEKEILDSDKDGIPDDKDPDDDNDGISDVDEIKYGLNPLNASDAIKDSDGDGYSNLDEIKAGTNPNDNGDYPSSKDELTRQQKTLFLILRNRSNQINRDVVNSSNRDFTKIPTILMIKGVDKK
jgi:hypothetical protein